MPLFFILMIFLPGFTFPGFQGQVSGRSLRAYLQFLCCLGASCLSFILYSFQIVFGTCTIQRPDMPGNAAYLPEIDLSPASAFYDIV
jgi:hypothetical protein